MGNFKCLISGVAVSLTIVAFDRIGLIYGTLGAGLITKLPLNFSRMFCDLTGVSGNVLIVGRIAVSTAGRVIGSSSGPSCIRGD